VTYAVGDCCCDLSSHLRLSVLAASSKEASGSPFASFKPVLGFVVETSHVLSLLSRPALLCSAPGHRHLTDVHRERRDLRTSIYNCRRRSHEVLAG